MSSLAAECIIRDLIKNTTTWDEHLKTCTTIDYFGEIMTENNDQESNELGIQYKFAFPLRASVYQEYLITDTIDLVGSVGGTLGLFIGFSFNNIITYIMGYIRRCLANRNKLSDSVWASMEWIIYIYLMAASIWFSWGVIYKFSKQDTGVQQYEEKIETYPTIVICMGLLNYQTDFKIKYCLDIILGAPCEEEIVLAMGENHLETLKEKVILTIIYTCLLYTSPSPRDLSTSRMPSSA